MWVKEVKKRQEVDLADITEVVTCDQSISLELQGSDHTGASTLSHRPRAQA